MAFQPTIIINGSASTAYPVLLQPGGVASLTALLRSGEFYGFPIQSKPIGTLNTTDSTSNVAAGAGKVFTPASMGSGQNAIIVGSLVNIDVGASMETVCVTAVTATTFTANCTMAHNGTVTPITMTSASFAVLPYLGTVPTLPAASPAPAAGTPSFGWWHLKTAAEKIGMGVEAAPVAGQVVFPMSGSDRIYGLLLWCQAGGAGELELIGH